MLPRLNHLGCFEKMLFRGVGFQSVGLKLDVFGGNANHQQKLQVGSVFESHLNIKDNHRSLILGQKKFEEKLYSSRFFARTSPQHPKGNFVQDNDVSQIIPPFLMNRILFLPLTLTF